DCALVAVTMIDTAISVQAQIFIRSFLLSGVLMTANASTLALQHQILTARPQNSGVGFLSVVVFQTLIGAATVWCAAQLARARFGDEAAVVAALIAAVYPYYVVQDMAFG